jgi:hypothetical protein
MVFGFEEVLVKLILNLTVGFSTDEPKVTANVATPECPEIGRTYSHQ